MIGLEFQYGQGIGNQLLCYVALRCTALDLGYHFGTFGRENLGDRRFNKEGLYFMDLDLGRECTRSDFEIVYKEKSTRVFLNTCEHDMTYGCDISLADADLRQISDGTLLYGNLQSEVYFKNHEAELKEWLKVKPEFDTHEFSRDDLCVINVRGGEYVNHAELFLNRDYWTHGMENMRRLNPQMKFIIVTEDVEAARRILPGVPCYHFGIAKDYAILKNAQYLLLSNSSFAILPAIASETVRNVIAPKYWARHNVSNGYWATGQNIYRGFQYQDRKGQLFESEECKAEFEKYKKLSKIYERPPSPGKGAIHLPPGILRFTRRFWLANKRILKALVRKTC